MNLRSLLSVAVGLAATMAAGQDPGSPPQTPTRPTPPTFAVATESVLLDVVVRDKDDRMVRDLTAADFEVYEDGVLQAIDQFMVVSREPAEPPPEPPPPPAEPEPHAAPTAPPVLAPPPTVEAPSSVIALVFDRLSVDGRRLAHQAAETYFKKERRQDDLVGVYSIDLALHTHQPFTNEGELIRAAIDRAAMQGSTPFTSTRGMARDLQDLQERVDQALSAIAGAQVASDAEGQRLGQTASAAGAMSMDVTAAQMSIRMLRSFESLERDQQGYATTNGLLAVVNGLRDMPGRKTVVFFSEGISIPPNVQAQFRSVIHAANRANVAVYAMDAGGLRVESPTEQTRMELQAASAARIRSLGREGEVGIMTIDLERNEDLLRLNPHSGLGQLTNETGGFLIKDTNDAARGFRQIGQDMRFHYVLGYSPTNLDWNGRFRNVTVKVRRSGVNVFSRKGYFGVKPGESKPFLDYELPAVAQLDRHPRPRAFPLGMAALSFPESGRPGLAPVVVEVPADAIRYQANPENNKEYHADFAVVARIRDAAGREVQRLSERYLLTAPVTSLDAARQGKILFYKEAELPSGRYTVEAVGYDAKAQQASVRTATLDVPPFAPAGGLRLSSVMIVKTAEVVPQAERNPAMPFSYGETILYPNLGEPIRKSTSPAVGFFFRAYPGGGPQPEATIEVLRDGHVLGKATADLPTPDADGRIQHAGALPLEGFTPGTYVLKVTVSDGHAREARVTPFTVAE